MIQAPLKAGCWDSLIQTGILFEKLIFAIRSRSICADKEFCIVGEDRFEKILLDKFLYYLPTYMCRFLAGDD
jgi:hypothetical protein